jgi:hypothetical protein
MIGRFLSVDPVTATSVGGNFNRYWYANDNPYKFKDPDGRFGECVGTLCDQYRKAGRMCELTCVAKGVTRPPAVISANASGGKTSYYKTDGTVEVRSGSRPWRNNNPGNLRKGGENAPSTRRAITWDSSPTRPGDQITKKLPFAVFATYEEGRLALAETLARTYGGKNVTETIMQYAPTLDGNNTVLYSNYILEHGGIPPNATIDQLTGSQLESAMDAIEHFEGFGRGGTVETYNYPGPF